MAVKDRGRAQTERPAREHRGGLGPARAPRPQGPKPGLSLERIVAAAVDVADAEGLGGGLDEPRRQASSAPSAMSLYRYVAAKDELLALMVDAALGDRPRRRRRARTGATG